MSPQTPLKTGMADIFHVIREHRAHNVHFTLESTREDAIRISLALPGERTEIDCVEDGHVEISRFHGNEAVDDDLAKAYEAIKSA